MSWMRPIVFHLDTEGSAMGSGPERTLENIDMFGSVMRKDPYPTYRELRESNPVYWDKSLQAWIVTRYEDVAFVLHDGRFSANRIAAATEQIKAPRYRPLLDIMAQKMSEKDEPDHMRLRSLVNKAFAHVALERCVPIVRRRANELLDKFQVANGGEFINDYAVPLPLLIILQIVGIPTEDTRLVKTWCDDFAYIALNYYTHLPEEKLEKALNSILKFREFLQKRIAELEAQPGDNLLSALIAAEHEGQKLSLEEMLANTFLILTAGNETTTCLLGNGLAALLEHPEQMQRLRDKPELIPQAVEEFLRFNGPVQYLGRTAKEDLPLHDKQIK
ncbi:MAG: cytochrome P450, partial [Pirellulaceae bacterium]|nr:cytochrome P450 [Pirellulaceae bacterium]